MESGNILRRLEEHGGGARAASPGARVGAGRDPTPVRQDVVGVGGEETCQPPPRERQDRLLAGLMTG